MYIHWAWLPWPAATAKAGGFPDPLPKCIYFVHFTLVALPWCIYIHTLLYYVFVRYSAVRSFLLGSRKSFSRYKHFKWLPGKKMLPSLLPRPALGAWCRKWLCATSIHPSVRPSVRPSFKVSDSACVSCHAAWKKALGYGEVGRKIQSK